MIEVRTPETHPDFHSFLNSYKNEVTIFLAGSIEMGKAEDWQTRLINDLTSQFKDEPYKVIVFNPRRNDFRIWEKQSIHNKYFKHQVEWELHHLINSSIKSFYFADGTNSPITLLEFGMCFSALNAVTYCTDKFYRKGNIDVVLSTGYNKNAAVETYEEFLQQIVKKIIEESLYVVTKV